MSNDDPIVAEFIVESREHLADVENQLLSIEAAGEAVDVDLVNTVFRAVHSIKGAAGFLGFSTMGDLAHALENVLNLIREGELVPDSSGTDTMLRAADTLRSMFDDIDSSNELDIAEHVNELQAIVAGAVEGQRPAAAGEAADSRHDDTRESSEIESPAEESQPANQPRRKKPARKKSTRKKPAGKKAARKQVVGEKPSRGKPAASKSAPKKPARPSTEGSSSPVVVDTSIRVSVRLLDHLMNLAGELVLSRNQLLQKVSVLRGADFDSVASTLDQVTSEIQEAIMQTRMQVVGTVLGKFPRIVRDLSRQLDKECHLVVHGSDVELDKSIIEAIGDPLTHLIRNAVDHGIESPTERERAGKSAEGTIVLRAFHQAGKVNITIEDDGAGIDAAKLREKAVARGVVTSEQASEMGERESLRLIFHPGFSMAEKVTDVSGRGVGMDVVRTNIEKLGGTVDVETELGQGTTISIKLPLTLAIVPSLVVHCAGQCFAIPQTNIRELVRVKNQVAADGCEAGIERVNGTEVFRLRGRLLPLVRLRDVLGLEPPESSAGNTSTHILVVESGPFHYGLIVDGLHDSEEIVVKPLGRHMKNCRVLAGATILGDGRVALILDVAGIATHKKLAMPESDKQREEEPAVADGHCDTHSSLMFRNHPEEQFAIPMEMVSRLERIRSDQIDSVGGVEVLQYRGVSLPLLSLEQHISAAPRTEAKRVHVAVFSVHGREIGLIVPHLQDIRCIGMQVDTATFREPGVIGCVEVDGRATRLLDLYELTQCAHPQWFPATNELPVTADAEQSVEQRPQRILLAEDSNFFRQQLVRYLSQAGFDVIEFEDGELAWRFLQSEGDTVDVVVTDIEMPNMDGCELSSRIKGDPELQHLPVIAVTSLSGEDDMQRGLEAGIDDYQIKLDRERLMACVKKFAAQSSRRRTLSCNHGVAPTS